MEDILQKSEEERAVLMIIEMLMLEEKYGLEISSKAYMGPVIINDNGRFVDALGNYRLVK